MLTKFVLYIDRKEFEIGPDSIQNWADVECTYKRNEFSGVIRSFMSKFEFVNEAYGLLMEAYDNAGVNADATVTMFVLTDNWEYVPEFSCQLDFSTLRYTGRVLTISAVDASISAIIKANKNTKYEFIVGEDVIVNGTKYMFDRLSMIESATYEITDGESEEDGSLTGSYSTKNNGRIFLGSVGEEIAVGGRVNPNTDQEYEDGYILKACKSVSLNLDYSIDVSREYGCARLDLMKNEKVVTTLHKAVAGNKPWLKSDQNSLDAVMDYINSNPSIKQDWATENWRGYWITIQGIVWVVERDDILGGNTWVNTGKTKVEYCSVLESGSITVDLNPSDRVWLKFCSDVDCEFKIFSSSLNFSWTNRGSNVTIDCISPDELLERLLWKMGANIDSVISNYDSRLKKTLLLAAESIRDLPTAKIYTSFNDFCNWMETVFGYVYVVDEDNGIIEFKHRNEIFRENAPVIDIKNAKDVEYSIESSVLYSNIVIGYDKKDYEGVNGRDEFNFNSTYMTGYVRDGKKLELKSPYRADSYGIEFLVEKRSQDTTDNGSDKDIFFVTGKQSGDYYRTDRSVRIENTLTGTLFNGEFSPVKCVMANSEYISIMFNPMTLTFASTEGCSDVRIDGTALSDDVILNGNVMLTAGELKFVCDDLNTPVDINSLVRVKTTDYIYIGYIKELNLKYAHPEAAEYTLMIKYKIPC